MTVTTSKLNVDRDVYEVRYDSSKVSGVTITAKFHNQENGDKSVYAGSNDGNFIVTVAKGYSGTDKVTIKGSDSGEETNEVSFG